MTRTRKWLVGTGLVLSLLLATLSTFDWNIARPYIERQLTSSTGRNFEIRGDLEVHLSLWPRIVANDIVMGNAGWSKNPTMARIKRAEFSISLLQLMRGRVSFPEIHLSDLHLLLEANQDGTPNWVFGKSARHSALPDMDALSIDNGTIKFSNPATNTDLSFVINTLASKEGQPDNLVSVTGEGKYLGMAAKINIQGGALLALRRADRPYPIKASVALGMSKASINGTLLDPLHLKSEKVSFTVEGADLAHLYPITGVPFPPTPPYKLSGYLIHSGDIWTFKNFEGRIGSSDLSGYLAVDLGKVPQLITADMKSSSLVMNDLSGFIGAGAGFGTRQSGRLLPARSYNLDKIRAADADVRFKGEKITTERLPIEKMDAHLLIKDGILRLAPLNFKTAGGSLFSEVTMDARAPIIVSHADITAKGLHLDQLLPPSKQDTPNQGVLGGRARLYASGNSIAQMMGSANGEAALIIDGGSISEMRLRLSNLDLANSFLLLVGGDKQVDMQCMVANFKVVDGNFKVQDLVLDTPKVNINGEGNVNFADESLHLRLVSQSKGFSLASLRGPILITGPFTKPKIKPDMKQVGTRGGIAVGLAAATVGLAGLIPLLDFGENKDSNCAALIGQAQSDAGIRQSDIKPH